MRTAVLLLLVACGDNRSDNSRKDAAPIPDAIVDAVADAPLPDASALPACANPVSGTTLKLRRLTPVGVQATFATAPRFDPRLFVLERTGRIRIYDESRQLLPDPFLDLSADSGGPVTSNGEELGLLGLAFHPDYWINGVFYVFYTHQQVPAEMPHKFRNIVARCKRSARDPNRADPTCVEVLSIKDPFANHNGGMMEFGRDGFLYIGTGDGGGAGDPFGNSQTLVDGAGDPNSVALLGKILRIDVDHPATGKEYGIPQDNPFAAGGGAPEIFALGLRNPWRWSFDSATGDMWIGDVGQGTIEEVDFVPAGELKGKNFGWDMWEGSNCFTPPCVAAGKTFPQIERTHAAPPAGNGWSAVIGGSVYRGTCYPDLVGTYIFANYGTRTLSKATRAVDGTISSVDVTFQSGDPAFPPGPTSIHADAFGELYITTTTGGVIYSLGAKP
jgi:glucose/arabinose dehydrogenase